MCLPYGGSSRSCLLGFALPSWRGVLHFLLQDGNDQVVLGHQVVLHYEACEPVTQERFILHTDICSNDHSSQCVTSSVFYKRLETDHETPLLEMFYSKAERWEAFVCFYFMDSEHTPVLWSHSSYFLRNKHIWTLILMMAENKACCHLGLGGINCTR